MAWHCSSPTGSNQVLQPNRDRIAVRRKSWFGCCSPLTFQMLQERGDGSGVEVVRPSRAGELPVIPARIRGADRGECADVLAARIDLTSAAGTIGTPPPWPMLRRAGRLCAAPTVSSTSSSELRRVFPIAAAPTRAGTVRSRDSPDRSFHLGSAQPCPWCVRRTRDGSPVGMDSHGYGQPSGVSWCTFLSRACKIASRRLRLAVVGYFPASSSSRTVRPRSVRARRRRLSAAGCNAVRIPAV